MARHRERWCGARLALSRTRNSSRNNPKSFTMPQLRCVPSRPMRSARAGRRRAPRRSRPTPRRVCFSPPHPNPTSRSSAGARRAVEARAARTSSRLDRMSSGVGPDLRPSTERARARAIPRSTPRRSVPARSIRSADPSVRRLCRSPLFCLPQRAHHRVQHQEALYRSTTSSAPAAG